jgi:hypothetical protein
VPGEVLLYRWLVLYVNKTGLKTETRLQETLFSNNNHQSMLYVQELSAQQQVAG